MRHQQNENGVLTLDVSVSRDGALEYLRKSIVGELRAEWEASN
jgi:hypothetical protein